MSRSPIVIRRKLRAARRRREWLRLFSERTAALFLASRSRDGLLSVVETRVVGRAGEVG